MVNAKITAVSAIFIVILCTSYFDPKPFSIREETDKYYLRQLHNLKEQLISFKKMSAAKAGLNQLQQQFRLSRLVYKKTAVMSEYFNIYETKFLNAPAINRVEEDNPDKIIPPAGFQAIEVLLFSEWNSKSYGQLQVLLAGMLANVTRLENEPDRANKFRNELVWDAIRSATVALITTGITGYDSPIAQYSLPETRASLDAIKDILFLFKKNGGTKNQKLFTDLLTLQKKAVSYLSTPVDFNRFDRIFFITQFIDPFYQALVQSREKAGIGVPEGSYPLHNSVASLFAPDAFNMKFFSAGDGFEVTTERIELGRKLFSDPSLSGTNSRSCASCHNPGKAFTDGLKTPFELDGETLLTRNTPTLWNSALQTRQFSDSRADILENQLDEVIHNNKEMRGSLRNSAVHLKEDTAYAQLFRKAYHNLDEAVTPFTIANAISSYIRSLISLNSRFDQFMRGNKTRLTASEKNGFNLFTGKAKCATCHFIPLFNGLVPPVFTETESEILGVPKTKDTKPAVLDPDPGKFDFTKSEIHKYAFKTPTLRNIELTAPYMHNGVYTTLEEVMDFYNKGGGKGLKIAPVNQSLPFDKLNLSKKEIADVISFMKSLTDTVYEVRQSYHP